MTYQYDYRYRDYRGNPYASNHYFHRVFLKIKFWAGDMLLKTVHVRSHNSI